MRLSGQSALTVLARRSDAPARLPATITSAPVDHWIVGSESLGVSLLTARVLKRLRPTHKPMI